MIGLALGLALGLANASGVVTYVTEGAAYVSVGKKDGLKDGTVVQAFRRKRPVGKCTVSALSDRRAVCSGARLVLGDRVVFTAEKTPPPPPAVGPDGKPLPPAPEKKKPTKKPPLPTVAELDKARAVVVAAPLSRFGFQRSAQVITSGWARGGLRQEFWYINSSPEGVFARSSLDLAARGSLGVGFFPDLFAQAAVRVQGDFLAPPDQRMRPGELLEVYVWGASIGSGSGMLVGEIGRFYPNKAPGMSLIDGAQLGLRLFGETTEVGAYGGIVPDVRTIYPALNRVVAGLYMGVDGYFTDDIAILPRLRAGIVSPPTFAGVRAEVEAQTNLVVNNIFLVGGSVRAGVGGTVNNAVTFDAARADADLTLARWLRLNGSYRYLAPLAVDYDLISVVTPVPGAHHGSTGVSWSPIDWVALGAVAGFGYDLGIGQPRYYVGPEVGFPTLFGSFGGLSVGYLEELSYIPGRSTWLQATFIPVDVLRLSSRVSYAETQGVLIEPVRETAFMFITDAPVLPWLTLRGRGWVQGALPVSNLGPARYAPVAVMVDLGVTGRL